MLPHATQTAHEKQITPDKRRQPEAPVNQQIRQESPELPSRVLRRLAPCRQPLPRLRVQQTLVRAPREKERNHRDNQVKRKQHQNQPRDQTGTRIHQPTGANRGRLRPPRLLIIIINACNHPFDSFLRKRRYKINPFPPSLFSVFLPPIRKIQLIRLTNMN